MRFIKFLITAWKISRHINVSAPFGYIQKDGLVRLPRFALEALNLPNGGGIIIDVNPNGIAIISHDEWCRKNGW